MNNPKPMCEYLLKTMFYFFFKKKRFIKRFVLFLFDVLKKSNALRFWFALVVFAYESATYSATMAATSSYPTMPE